MPTEDRAQSVVQPHPAAPDGGPATATDPRRLGPPGQFDSTGGARGIQVQLDEWLKADRPRLGQVLTDMGVITEEELEVGLKKQRETGFRLGTVLEIREGVLAEAVARQFHLEMVDLRQVDPDPAALDAVGEALSRRYRVLPLRLDPDGRVWVVTADPVDAEAIGALVAHCNKVGLLVGTWSDIDRLLAQEFNALSQAHVFIEALELTAEEAAAAADDSRISDESAPVVQVVNRVLTQGVRSRASDIHIEAHVDKVLVRFRVDGALADAIELPVAMGPALSSRIKVMAGLNIVERRRPQDGQFSMDVDNRPIDVRTSSVPTIHGEKIVLRLLDKERSLLRLDDLGMAPQFIEPFTRIVKAPQGMVLVTGPTGSGKTTTLYATLNQVNDPSKNVVTIEDPVEYQFDGVNQMQVSDGGMDFAAGLRGVLRQDPDTILVGEIRDLETASIAMQASLTGHFVLSSLHAVDSVAALHRFTDMGVEPFLVASAITGSVGQRLLRRNCPACKIQIDPHPDHLELVRSHVGDKVGSYVFSRGIGCNLCNNTGYQGRIGVYELCIVDDPLREMIVNRETHSAMRRVAIAGGMIPMHVAALEMAATGMTTVEEVLRGVYTPGTEFINGEVGFDGFDDNELADGSVTELVGGLR
jgi:type IV pilus assembly protein PilB